MEVCGRLLRGEVVCGGVDVRLRLRLTPRGCGVRGVSGLGWGPARFSEPGCPRAASVARGPLLSSAGYRAYGGPCGFVAAVLVASSGGLLVA